MAPQKKGAKFFFLSKIGHSAPISDIYPSTYFLKDGEKSLLSTHKSFLKNITLSFTFVQPSLTLQPEAIFHISYQIILHPTPHRCNSHPPSDISKIFCVRKHFYTVSSDIFVADNPDWFLSPNTRQGERRYIRIYGAEIRGETSTTYSINVNVLIVPIVTMQQVWDLNLFDQKN